VARIDHQFSEITGLQFNWTTTCSLLRFVFTIINHDNVTKNEGPTNLTRPFYQIPIARFCGDSNITISVVIVNGGGANEPAQKNIRTGRVVGVVFVIIILLNHQCSYQDIKGVTKPLPLPKSNVALRC